MEFSGSVDIGPAFLTLEDSGGRWIVVYMCNPARLDVGV
jgi:hypothetical protein